MVTFRRLWEWLVEELQTNADSLKVKADNIDFGIVEFDSKGLLKIPAMEPPFIFVYCIPGESTENQSGSRMIRNADIGILCSVASEENTVSAIINCVEFCERVEDVIKKMKGLQFTSPIIEIANPTATSVRAVIGLKATYKSSMEV